MSAPPLPPAPVARDQVAASAAVSHFRQLADRLQQASAVLHMTTSTGLHRNTGTSNGDELGHVVALAAELVGLAQDALFNLAASGQVPLETADGGGS